MCRSAVLIVLCMLIAIPYGCGSAIAAPSTSAQDSLRFTRLSVKDPGINNIEAVSILIPAGWKAEGGVQWFPDYSILANLLMRISDPQTGAAIEFLPIQNFTWLTQMVMQMQPGTNYLGNTNWKMGTFWSVHSAYSFRAPKGQLDRLTPLMNTTVSSARLSPEWYGGYMYVQKLFQDRMKQSIKNAAAISATITRNSEEIRRMFSESN